MQILEFIAYGILHMVFEGAASNLAFDLDPDFSALSYFKFFHVMDKSQKIRL